MANRFTFRQLFNALTLSAAVAFAPSFADAAERTQKPKPAATQKKRTATPQKKPAAKAKATAAKPQQPVAAPAKKTPKPPFVPKSPTGESCPDPNADNTVQWINPVFDAPAREQQQYLAQIGMNIGRHNPDGFFNERATQSVNEFRIFSRQEPFRESMTAQNLEDLKSFASQVKRDAQAYNLETEDATALRFAANATGTSIPALLAYRRDFRPDTATWLYLVDTFGHKYGLSFYADRINLTKDTAGSQLFVKDSAMFEQILDLMHHPRVFAVMMAEHSKQKDVVTPLPETVTPDVAQQQAHFTTLGFDLGDEAKRGVFGPMTTAAYLKFERLYGPAYTYFGDVADKSRDAYIERFAKQAQKDAQAYRITTPAAAAIRLANIRTGADFGYMMELSSAESSFDPSAQAATSSATGLYQFTEDTWLHMIKRYGDRYGMDDLADQVEAKNNMYGVFVARVENPFVRASLLELRRDPHIAALMSAEFQLRNTFMIECSVGRELNRTEQYLGHFLGSRGAAHFLNKMAENPNLNGAKLFPTAAEANKSIFYSRDSKGRLQPRTLKQIYNVLDKKFETGSYEDHGVKVQVDVLQGDLPQKQTPPNPEGQDRGGQDSPSP